MPIVPKFWIAGALLLAGCGIVDSYRMKQQAKSAVAKLLLDPESADFRNVEVRNGYICGEVNGHNSMGAYVGFRRFVVDPSDWSALIDPQFDYSDLIDADSLCASMRANDYSSAAATVSTCDRADEKRAESLRQDRFNSAWAANCQASARLPFQPPLEANAGQANEIALPDQVSPDLAVSPPASDQSDASISNSEGNAAEDEEAPVDMNDTDLNDASEETQTSGRLDD